MAVQIQIRRGTAANWTSTNPTLAEGELGYETDTGKLKAGDGSTAWTGLSYISGTGAISDIVSDTTPQLGGNLDVNGQSIVSVSNGNITITPDGTGSIVLDGLNWPQSDGSADQVLKTNGSGTLSFGDASVVATTLDLTDTPGSYGTAGEVLALNSGASAFEFVANVASGGIASTAGAGNVAEGSISDVVALTQDQYDNRTVDAADDAKTLYVITDGTTSIGDSDDVTITGTPATGSLLVYDVSGDWINAAPAAARTAIGLEIGTDVQAHNDELTAIAALGSAGDRIPYYTGSKTASLTGFTSFGRTLVAGADAAAGRTALGLVIGTDVQAHDADLDALAGLTSAADALPYFTGSGTAATTTLSSFGRTLIDDADAATARATLGANDASNLTTGTLPAARLPAITDSYVGHIETPADGTYYLDPKVAEAREITGVYFAWTAGGSPDGDIDVQIGGTSVLSATGRMNSGTTFTGTIKTDGTEDVAADAVITVVLGGTNGVADITDLRFAVEYTQ